MAKKRSASSAHDRPTERSARHTPDRDIDYSDIPPSTDEELRRARRGGRPKSGMAKQFIAIRLSPRLLAARQKVVANQGKPYQTLMQEFRERAASRPA